MRKYLLLILLAALGLSSCEDYKEEVTTRMREAERDIYTTYSRDDDGGGGGNKPSYCTQYNGPEGDIQITSFCMSAYNYVCNAGFDPRSEEIQTYCNMYEQMRDGTSLGICPYCE